MPYAFLTCRRQGAWITRESRESASGAEKIMFDRLRRLITLGWNPAGNGRKEQPRVSMKAKAVLALGLILLTLASLVFLVQVDSVSDAAQKKMTALKNLPSIFHASPARSR